MSEIVAVDPAAPDAAVLGRAAGVLRRGGLVAFPTETVYGLGANALDAAAVARIFAAKGRPSFNPLIAHVENVAGARKLAAEWPQDATLLADEFWPGPLTLVLRKREEVPDAVTAGLPTVAIRVPAHPVALALLRAAGVPLAAPSANRYTELSPTTAEHVLRALDDRVDLILDGGPTDVGIESTVVDLSAGEPVLLRPGVIGAAELERVLGRPLARREIGGDAPRPSPGMVERHYAPRAELRVFAADERGPMREAARQAAREGTLTGALLLSPFDAPIDQPLRMPDRPAAYARELYAALHRLDDEGCRLVLADAVPEGSDWDGVRDRLRRAATG